MDFVKILGFIVPIALFVFKVIAKKLMKNEDEEKEYSYITLTTFVVCLFGENGNHR